MLWVYLIQVYFILVLEDSILEETMEKVYIALQGENVEPVPGV